MAVDSDGVIVVFNPAAERLLGYSTERVIGRMNIRDLYSSEEEAKKVKRSMIAGEGRLEGYEASLVASDKRIVPIRLSAAMLGQGRSIGFFHDMTQQKNLEASLKKLSITDDLSGLYNQRYFYSQLAKEMARAKRYGNQLSLICIDLDGFKQVNDQLGHLEGDQVVRQIGVVLNRGLRDSDQAFRYGGDEFMLLLPNTTADHARSLAERVRQAFNAECMYSPDFFNDNGIIVSVSMGIATSFGEEPVDHFIQQADLAMYQAKQSGGNCARLFHNVTD